MSCYDLCVIVGGPVLAEIEIRDPRPVEPDSVNTDVGNYNALPFAESYR